MLQRLFKWRDDRVQLRLAMDERDRVWRDFMTKQHEKLSGSLTDEEWESYVSQHFNEMDLLGAEIAEIETRRIVDRAVRWDVPYPPPPWEKQDDTPHWHWHRVHGRHYLSTEGKALVRRDTYAEIEMRYRPMLSWAAVAISIVSLVVSVFKP